ncbi:aldo/keto reductase [Actinomycetaceae bacterium WB03_NA08]|uniref:Aldo/keto reductase n=1 Tax=Scrofimicrobium canadense TaxID=2652290 RepID=A0A6N7WBA1_9ACTO|nr:aldo/keto reductase [Scrofimicrobium canadense]MSS85496.1 aldo/keto reductase [Scrofimicrobium canadense]
MENRKPHLIFGTMGLGGTWSSPDYGTQEIDKAWNALHAASEIGINVLDTADIYRMGSSESVIGDVLRKDHDLASHFSIQTKCGIQLSNPTTGEITRYDLSGEHISRALDASLERLGVDHIDTLLLHRPDPLMDPESVATAVTDAIRQKKILRWGVSNMSSWQIDILREAIGTPIANQLELSLAARSFIEVPINALDPGKPGSNYAPGTVEYCAAAGIEIQAWSPLARGLYTGAPEDHIGRSRTEAEKKTSTLTLELASKYDTSVETILLWWLTMHPAAIRPVIGTSSVERIYRCGDANTKDSHLTRDEWYSLWTTARGAILP